MIFLAGMDVLPSGALHCMKKKSGKRVSRWGREKRDSEEVCHLNFVGGGRPQHEESEVPLLPALNAIWAGSPKIIVGRKSVFMT